MTRIFIPGGTGGEKSDGGYALLRTLAVMFIIILCFAAFLGGLSAYSRGGTVFLRRVVKEIQDRDESRLRALRQ
jgi:MFS-type transporter involved in bile tolerance (Atg22 family)